MSASNHAEAVTAFIERVSKCWMVDHRHEPFICESCNGSFCRYAETSSGATDDPMSNYCLECWQDPDGNPPDDGEEDDDDEPPSAA